MTAPDHTMTAPRPRLHAGPQLLPVIASEWHKLRTTRSTVRTALLAGAVSVLVGFLHCRTITAANAPPGLDPVGASLFGLTVAQLIAAVAGVLCITNEYASGTIYPTLTATPQRGRLLAAKIAVTLSASFAYGLAVTVASFAAGAAVLSGHHIPLTITSVLTVRRLLGAATLFAAMALIGLALGTLARRTAGGLVAIIAVIALPVFLADPFNAATRQQINRMAPLRAADALIQAHPDATALRPWAALAVLTAEICLLLAAASIAFHIRDA